MQQPIPVEKRGIVAGGPILILYAGHGWGRPSGRTENAAAGASTSSADGTRTGPLQHRGGGTDRTGEDVSYSGKANSA